MERLKNGNFELNKFQMQVVTHVFTYILENDVYY